MVGEASIEPERCGERWYVVQTRAHKESSVWQRLIEQGFRTFLPMHDRTVRHARRLTTVRRAVFPRYMFVSFDRMTTQWRSINGTIGVDKLVMYGDRPQAVRPGVIESLIASIDEEDRLQFRQPLNPGDPVRLLSGPFAEHLGVLDSLGPKQRVHVLLSFLHGPVRVQVDRSGIALVD